MSPIGSDGDALQPSHQGVQGTDVPEANVISDQFEQFDARRALYAPGRGSRNSSASSERLDRLEGLEEMAKQQARFM
ncbi:Glycoside hydrolase [Phytophthora megakarya]|uniref:Glycoside hydrolase n=1 Tax=Phytophthora megakarya TaxID=4795 RepID=A0A225W4R2_9STRA|nr:Glycoside hydrolase [Phytophthora megakarya]